MNIEEIGIDVALEVNKMKDLIEVIIDEFTALDFKMEKFKGASKVANLLCILEDQVSVLDDALGN